MRTFVVVAEERNFNRAAARLLMSQPAVSRQIKELERALGVRVFERTPRGVEFTPAGANFLPACRDALAAVERAIAEARNAGSGERGVVRLG